MRRAGRGAARRRGQMRADSARAGGGQVGGRQNDPPPPTGDSTARTSPRSPLSHCGHPVPEFFSATSPRLFHVSQVSKNFSTMRLPPSRNILSLCQRAVGNEVARNRCCGLVVYSGISVSRIGLRDV